VSKISDIIRQSSAVVIACQNHEAPDEICEAIGRAIVMGKPVICIVKPGIRVPAKLSLIVDRYIEWLDDQEALAVAVRDTMIDLGVLNGGKCACDECKKETDPDRSWQDGENSQN
jgi:hypothetical protein